MPFKNWPDIDWRFLTLKNAPSKYEYTPLDERTIPLKFLEYRIYASVQIFKKTFWRMSHFFSFLSTTCNQGLDNTFPSNKRVATQDDNFLKVYRQLGDLSLGRGPVGGSASWGILTCRISWAQFLFLFNFILWMQQMNTIFFK